MGRCRSSADPRVCTRGCEGDIAATRGSIAASSGGPQLRDVCTRGCEGDIAALSGGCDVRHRACSAFSVVFAPEGCAAVVGQVGAHEMIEVRTVGHTFRALASAEPRSATAEGFAQCDADVPFERVRGVFPVDESSPADEDVDVCRRGADLMQSPVARFAGLTHSVNDHMPHSYVERHRRCSCCRGVTLRHHSVRRQHTFASSNISLRLVRHPRAIGVIREEIDRHVRNRNALKPRMHSFEMNSCSRGCRPAGMHPRLRGGALQIRVAARGSIAPSSGGPQLRDVCALATRISCNPRSLHCLLRRLK